MSEPNRVSGRSTSPALVKVFFGSNMQISFCIFPPFTCICNRTTLQTVTSPVCSLLTIFSFPQYTAACLRPRDWDDKQVVRPSRRSESLSHHARTLCIVLHIFYIFFQSLHCTPYSFRRDLSGWPSLPGGHTESHFLFSIILHLIRYPYRSRCRENLGGFPGFLQKTLGISIL